MSFKALLSPAQVINIPGRSAAGRCLWRCPASRWQLRWQRACGRMRPQPWETPAAFPGHWTPPWLPRPRPSAAQRPRCLHDSAHLMSPGFTYKLLRTLIDKGHVSYRAKHGIARCPFDDQTRSALGNFWMLCSTSAVTAQDCNRSSGRHTWLLQGYLGTPPENTGVSSGPVTCKTPLTPPPMGNGSGRIARVFRRSFASTPATLALSLYWPLSGFRSMSPAGFAELQRVCLAQRRLICPPMACPCYSQLELAWQSADLPGSNPCWIECIFPKGCHP